MKADKRLVEIQGTMLHTLNHAVSLVMLSVTLIAAGLSCAEESTDADDSREAESSAESQAEEKAENTPDNWKAERAKLKKDIKEIARKQAEKTITKRKVAKKLDFQWPVEKPTRPAEEIKKEISQQVEKKVDEKYPLSQMKEFRKEAKKKYPLLDKGDRTSFTIRGGKGRGAHVKNEPFHKKSSRRVHIGSQWLLRDDLPPEIEARFYPSVNKKFRSDYVRRNKRQYKARRKNYAEQIRNRLARKKFKEANYIYDETRQKWVSKVALLKRAVRHFREKRTEKLLPKIEQRVFTNNGYKKKQGEWKPAGILDKLKEAGKSLSGDAKDTSPSEEEMPEGIRAVPSDDQESSKNKPEQSESGEAKAEKPPSQPDLYDEDQ